MTEWVATFVFLGGIAAITAGAWMYSEPAGLITGGVFAVALAWFFRKGGSGSSRTPD